MRIPFLRDQPGPARLFVTATVRRYMESGSGHWAAAIALNLLLTFFPIVLVALFAVGTILQDPASRDAALRAIAQTLPGGQGGEAYAQVASALDAVRQSTTATGILGILGLIWAGSGLFSTIEAAFGAVYGFAPRSFIRGKAMAIGLVLVIAGGLVASIAASSALALIRRLAHTSRERIPLGDTNLYLGELGVVAAAGLLVGIVIFRVIPRPRRPWNAVLPGAAVFAAGFELLTLMFPLYMGLSGLESRFGQTFGLFLLLVIYASLQAQVVVIAACVNATVGHWRVRDTDADVAAEQGAVPGTGAVLRVRSDHPPG